MSFLGEYPEDEQFKAILVPEVLRADQNLSISRFFIQEEILPSFDLDEELVQLRQAQNRFNTAQNNLLQLLETK